MHDDRSKNAFHFYFVFIYLFIYLLRFVFYVVSFVFLSSLVDLALGVSLRVF